MIKFDWDPEKNIINQQKHEISFEQAVQIFNGTEEIEYDSEHSTLTEDRFKAFGFLNEVGSIVVIFIEIIDNEMRIISARKV